MRRAYRISRQAQIRWPKTITRSSCAITICVIAAHSLLLCGCGAKHWLQNEFKVGPEYTRPAPSVIANDWIENDNSSLIPAQPQHADWWSVFNDPKLNQMIQTAHGQNLSLREAGWRVMQARARRAIAQGNFFPQTQLGFGEFERIQESGNLATPVPLRNFDQWATGFNLAWELDVWGRFRRAIASADADLEASIGDYDAILLCLIADVATAYADYRTFQQRLEYARKNVVIQERSLEIAQAKADEGKTDFTGVHLAKSSLETTRAAIPGFEIGLRQATNQLCTLLGITIQDLAPQLGIGDIPNAPSEVAVGIPFDLLRRRPDVRASERAIAAQSEQIGIAEADLYPHFSINGEIALESEKFSDLFASASTAGAIGPSFRWNLLNYGRIINNVRLQGYGFEELIARYQNTVLTANQEVEDAMIAFLKNQERVEFLEVAAAETAEALRLLTISFEEGDISFTGVFILQGELAARQDQLAAAQGDVVISLISLYKALGGGWQTRCPNYHSRGIVTETPFPGELTLPPIPEKEGIPSTNP